MNGKYKTIATIFNQVQKKTKCGDEQSNFITMQKNDEKYLEEKDSCHNQ